MGFCTNWGKELPGDAKFCQHCGTSADGHPNPFKGNSPPVGGSSCPPAVPCSNSQIQPTGAGGRTSNPGAFSLSFSGRARRSDYWVMTVIAGLGAGVMVAICLVSIGINVFQEDFDGEAAALSPGAGLLLVCIGLPLLIWYLATGVRRCHDLGWSGWVILIQLLPYVGWLAGAVLFSAFAFVDGQPGPNRFGPDPKGRRPPWKQTDTNPR